MSVYIDPLIPCIPNKNWKYDHACHMFSDDISKLHEMALKIGLKKSWFHSKQYFPHYDLTPSKRNAAIKKGAIALTRREAVEKWNLLWPRKKI